MIFIAFIAALAVAPFLTYGLFVMYDVEWRKDRGWVKKKEISDNREDLGW